MASESIADLFASLRLAVDERTWSIGDRILNNFKNKIASVIGTLADPSAWAGAIGGVIDAGDAIDEASQKTGVAVETLQEFGYAAGQSGVSQEGLNSALGKLAVNMDTAAHGGKAQAEIFDRMGVKVTDASGKLRDAGDVFLDISDHLSTIKDGGVKAALAVGAFGRSGKDLIPTLNAGRTHLEELRKEFRESGAEIDGPTAAAMGGLNDQIGVLKLGWQGVKTQLASALVPTLLEVVNGFVAWFKANRQNIKSGIQAFAKVLAVALKAVAFAVGLALKGFTFLADHWDYAKYAIYALVAALGVYEAATIAAGIASAISWLAALWPIGLVIAAIALVALAIEDFYTYLQGGDSYFGDLVDYAKEYLGVDLTNTVQEVVDFAVGAFGEWWDTAKMMFAFIEAEASIVSTAWTTVWNTIKPIVDAIKEAVGYVDDLTNSVANPFGGNFLGGGSGLVRHQLNAPQGSGAFAQMQRIAAQAGSSGAPATVSAQPNVLSAFHANVTIHAGAGADGKLIGEEFTKVLDKHWDEKMRGAHGGAGGK